MSRVGVSLDVLIQEAMRVTEDCGVWPRGSWFLIASRSEKLDMVGVIDRVSSVVKGERERG